MDVSNSSGGSTGYRVLGSGGTAPCPPEGAAVQAESNLPEGDCVVEELSLEEEAISLESSQEQGAREGKPAQTWVREGTLKANTYATVPVFGSGACIVEFLRDLRDKKPIHRYKVQGRYEELLVALVPNGDGTPKFVVCSKAKV